jgi:ADP-ribosylglycohydrolase
MYLDAETRLARARLSLEGLSVGDAFGETFFMPSPQAHELIEGRLVSERLPWRWTDDTAMALSIVDVLAAAGTIDVGALGTAFAARYLAQPWRGYGPTAQEILCALGDGVPWQVASAQAFGGEGSMGNGGAMRSAPIGAYFADDLDRVVAEARRSALPTHGHPDGQAGAIAVAVAAAVATTMGDGRRPRDGRALIAEVVARTPAGPTRRQLEVMAGLDTDDVRAVARAVGNGSQVIASDTVPLSVWCAARHLGSYQEALWTTLRALGDRDTTCAIVGGIVVMSAGLASIPVTWRESREPLRWG